MSLWERINRDPRYLEARQQIQSRYGLPLDFDIRAEPEKWSRWLGAGQASTSQRTLRGQAFLEDVQALFRRFQVPETWHPDFMADIASLPTEETAESLSQGIRRDLEAAAPSLAELQKKDSAAIRPRERLNAARRLKSFWDFIRKALRRGPKDR